MNDGLWRVLNTVSARVTLAILGCFLIASSAFAKFDPAHKWRTLKSEHFRIHYYEGEENLATRVYEILEWAYSTVTEDFGLTPSQTVEIVISDDYDIANGFTSVYPYDHVVVLAYPPEPESEIGSFEDYLVSLLIHEYAHVVQMDQYSGAPGVINRVFGKLIVPNGAVPDWFAEGFAVYMESRLAPKGRLQSSLYKMFLMTQALAGRIPDISEITEPPLILPRGSAPYMYGGYFFEFLSRKYGKQKLAAFIKDYGKRLIPFALNHLARRHFGRDFGELWREFVREVRGKASAWARNEAEIVEGKALTKNGEFNGYAVLSADGKRIYYVQADGKSREQVLVMDISSGRKERILDCFGGCGHLYLSGDFIYTTHTEPHRIYSSFMDIFRVNVKTKDEERLTEAGRAKDPSVTSDSKVLFVQSRLGEVRLVALSANGGQEVLIEGGIFQGMADPRPIPNSRLVVFSGAMNGQWDLWTVDMDTKNLERLTCDAFLDRDPRPEPSGRYIFFSSDRGGHYDIFAYDLEKKQVFRITRSRFGAFWPSSDGNEIVYSTYGPKGYDLALLPLSKSLWELEASPEGCSFEKPQRAFDAYHIPKSTKYNPLRTLYPRQLKPTYVASSTGVSRLGATIFGSDAASIHSFSASFESDTSTFSPSYGLSYTYSGLFPDITLSYGCAPVSFKSIVEESPVDRTGRYHLFSASLSQPLPGRIRSFALSLGYYLQWFSEPPKVIQKDPAKRKPSYSEGKSASAITFGLAYSSVEAYTYSISPERGISAGLNLALKDETLGSASSAFTIRSYLFSYLPVFRLHNHVIALLLSYDASFGKNPDSFALGGFEPQDIVEALVTRTPSSSRYLRGYKERLLVGSSRLLLNLEYRFPILYIHKGLDTLPVVARRLFATIFFDSGSAWESADDLKRFRTGAGAELALSMNLFLDFPFTLRLGYARGFQEGGENVFFLRIAQ